jgi:hypothetical protein
MFFPTSVFNFLYQYRSPKHKFYQVYIGLVLLYCIRIIKYHLAFNALKIQNTPHGKRRSITGTNTPRVNSLARREIFIHAASALTSERWSNQMQIQTDLQSPPSPMTPSVSEDKNDSELEPRHATDLPPQFIERLIKLSSSSRSWRSPDDEVVDLTEPRLETFTQPSTFRPNFI